MCRALLWAVAKHQARRMMTLLKNAESFMDQDLALDLAAELRQAGFDAVTSTLCSPRHRLVLARVAL
jgi:hypothetical protein